MDVDINIFHYVLGWFGEHMAYIGEFRRISSIHSPHRSFPLPKWSWGVDLLVYLLFEVVRMWCGC